uniref:Uncharacterized protein n=1 Tax=Percolomonas cosmopolitus TaxID=63605 RepID=A0A7S1KN56_9EUKA
MTLSFPSVSPHKINNITTTTTSNSNTSPGRRRRHAHLPGSISFKPGHSQSQFPPISPQKRNQKESIKQYKLGIESGVMKWDRWNGSVELPEGKQSKRETAVSPTTKRSSSPVKRITPTLVSNHWNSATLLDSPREQNKQFQRLHEVAVQASRKTRNKHLNNKKTYTGPQIRARQLAQNIRQQKLQERHRQERHEVDLRKWEELVRSDDEGEE